MKRTKFCEFCGKKINFRGHLMVLSLLHLEIEHFPKIEFKSEEALEKAAALKRHVSVKNIHFNLAYATTQLINLSSDAKADRELSSKK